MKVALVLNTSWNAYNFRSGLIKTFLSKNWEVHVIAPTDEFSEKLIQAGCIFHPVKMENKGANPFKDLLLILQFRKIFKKVNPDVILQFTIKPNIYGALAASMINIPVINNISGLGTVFLHDNFKTSIAKRLYRFALRFPYRVFFQNEDDRNLFVKNKLADQAKTDLLPGSGVDLNRFTNIPLPESQVFTFLVMSRVLYDKGIIELIGAARIMKAKKLNFRILLAGALDKESNLGIPEKLLNEWSTEGLIEYKGFVESTTDLIKLSSCVVLPSYREGTPKSLLESAASGRPLIATNVPGCKEVVIDGFNGFLCEVKNSADLAEKMEKMLSLDLQKIKELGLNSRKLVQEKFDEKIVIDKYLKVIEEIRQLKLKNQLKF